MKKEVRKTGIDIIGDVRWGMHLCVFYQSKEDLIDILVPYFKAGLENNEFCMWVTSEPLKVEEAKSSLKKAIKNLDDYIAKGQIEILDYSRWYTKSGKFETDKILQGWVEKEVQALKMGFDGLRLTGNTSWLEKNDWKKFADYEAIVNNTIGKYRMIAVCSYFLDKCHAGEIIEVVSNHQFALIKKEGKWVTLESSEHKKAKEELQKSEIKFKTLIEHIPKKVFIKDKNSVYIFCNKNYADGLKIKPEKIVGKTDYDFYPKELAEKYRSDDKRIMEAGKTEDIEEKYIEHGQEMWVHTVKTPYKDEKGNIIGVLGTFRDITESKKLEREKEKFLKAIEIAKEAINITDSKGNMIYTNDSMDELFGYKKGELIGKCLPILHAGPQPETVTKKIMDGIEKLGFWEGEIRNKRKDGREFIAYAIISAVKDKDGKILNFISTQHDITERKKAEERLRESEEQAKIFAAYQHVISELRDFYIREVSLEQMLQKTVDLIVEGFGYYMAWYGELKADEKVIIPKVWAGKYEKYLDGLRLELDDSKDARCAMSIALVRKEPFGYADLEHDKDFEKWRPLALKYGYRSNQAVPFILRGKCIGAFLIYSSRPFTFSERLVEYLKGIIDELATIIENITERKKSEEEIKYQAQKMSLINAIANAVNQSLNLDKVLQIALNKTLEQLKLTAGAIYLLDEQGEELVMRTYKNLPEQFVDKVAKVKLKTAKFINSPLATGQVLLVDDLSRHPAISKISDENWHNPVAIIPLKTKNRIIGNINLLGQLGRPFASKDIDTLMAIGYQISIAIENANLYKQAQKEIAERKKTEAALRESEEFARRVIESSNDCIKVLDLDGNLLSMSRGGQKLLEIDDITPYLNRSFVDFWKGKDREAALEAISKAKKGNAGIFYGYCETAKGTPKWWGIIISPIKDSHGNIDRLLSVSRDITERKKAEDQLKEYTSKLEEQKISLEQKNLALKEIIEHIERTKNRMKEDIAINIDETLMPIVGKLKIKGVSPRYIKLLGHHLKNLSSSFGRKITQRNARLTSREIEICNMIKGGLASKDISELLNLSRQTIEKHRKNIRKKLGLSNKKANLSSYLQNF